MKFFMVNKSSFTFTYKEIKFKSLYLFPVLKF